MTVFRAIGGLGNQLFVAAAAMAYGHFHSEEVLIDDRRKAKGHIHGGPHAHQSDLSEIVIPGLKLARGSWAKTWFAGLDIGASIFERIRRMRGVHRQFSNLYTSQATGYDDAIFTRRMKYVRGYFQSYRYLNYLRQFPGTWNIHLANVSSQLMRRYADLGDQEFTAVHIRRGDYVKLQTNFGLLSHSYYINGLEELKKRGQLFPVKVFSDHPGILESPNFVNLIAEYGAEFIETADLTPAESLMLMSKGRSFVIANSSFSWWAAAESHSSSVVFPKPWFRAEPQPESLTFPDWIELKSEWTTS